MGGFLYSSSSPSLYFLSLLSLSLFVIFLFSFSSSSSSCYFFFFFFFSSFSLPSFLSFFFSCSSSFRLLLLFSSSCSHPSISSFFHFSSSPRLPLSFSAILFLFLLLYLSSFFTSAPPQPSASPRPGFFFPFLPTLTSSLSSLIRPLFCSDLFVLGAVFIGFCPSSPSALAVSPALLF